MHPLNYSPINYEIGQFIKHIVDIDEILVFYNNIFNKLFLRANCFTVFINTETYFLLKCIKILY